MSRKTRTVLALLCALTIVNSGAALLNMAQPSRAAVAGMKAQDLESDRDFVAAVQAIASRCRVNVDLAKLSC